MFPASPLPNWQVLGADRRVPVPPPQPRPHTAGWEATVTKGGEWNHSAWPPETPPSTPARIASDAPFPHPLQKPASGSPALPGPGPAATSEEVTRSGSRAESGEHSGEHGPPGSGRALPAARRCLCPSPRNWNSTTAARSWNHVLPLPPLPPARATPRPNR